jgi:pimeloyl-ACP methyl ester carboxylesterase
VRAPPSHEKLRADSEIKPAPQEGAMKVTRLKTPSTAARARRSKQPKTAGSKRVASQSGAIKTEAAWTDAQLSLGKAKIYYEVSRPASGPVKGSVVMLHELHTDHTDSKDIRDALVKKGYAVLTADAPFSGNSYVKNARLHTSGEPITLADDSRGYGAAMKAANLPGPVTVYGLSRGGGNALMTIVAAGMQNKVDKVVLGAPYPHDILEADTNDLYEMGAAPVRGLVNGLAELLPGLGMLAQAGLGAYEAVAKPLITGGVEQVVKPIARFGGERYFDKYFRERFPANEVKARVEATNSRIMPESSIDLDGNAYEAADWIKRLGKNTKLVIAVGADDKYLRKLPNIKDNERPLVDAARTHLGAQNVEYLSNIPGLGHDITRERPDLVVKWLTTPIEAQDA